MKPQDEFKTLKAKFEKETQALQDRIKASFSDMAKEVFETLPKINSFRWNQYTPYFNDGDTCEFSANKDEYSIRVNGRCDDYEDEANEGEELEDSEYEQAKDLISGFLSSFDDTLLKGIFGDHAEITVNRNGTVSVDEYSHD